MDSPTAPPQDPWIRGTTLSAFPPPPAPIPVSAFDPSIGAALTPPPRPDRTKESVQEYVRSSSLAVTGIFLALMAVGLLVGYANGPHNLYSATQLGGPLPVSFTVGGIFLHNLMVVAVPLILFPILFWAPAASAAITGYASGQLIAAWLAVHLPGGALAGALLPHGVVEIPAILLGGTMAWRIGRATWGQRTFGGTWGERAQTAARAALPVVMVVVVALGVAAFIEVKVTPLLVARLVGY